ncbi:MAG: T9SS type A sorting domain-containing protein [Chitinophagales bacterium]
MKSSSFTLEKYSILATGIFSYALLNGQVVYTDIDPDVILFKEENKDEGWKYFNMDQNGDYDVALHWEEGYNCEYCAGFLFFQIYLPGDNRIAVAYDEPCSLYSSFYEVSCYFPAHPVAKVFHNGDIIQPKEDFQQIHDIFRRSWCGYSYGEFCFQGFFSGSGEQFLGFHIPEPDPANCWLRLYWADDTLLVNDMACNFDTTTAFTIEAPVVSAELLSVSSTRVWMYSGDLHIETDADELPVAVNIISIDGKLLGTYSCLEEETIIPLDLSPGIYLAVLEGMDERKVYRFGAI